MKIDFSRKTIAAGVAAALVLSLFVIFAIRYRAATGAYVNGERLLIAPINKRIEILRKRDPNRFSSPGGQGEEQQIRRSLLEERIALKIISQNAAKAGVTVSEAQIDAKLEQLGRTFKNQAAFNQQLADEGLSGGLGRDLIGDQLMGDKMRAKLMEETKVTDAEVANYLNFNKQQFTGATPQVKLGVIVLANSADADRVIGSLKTGRLTWEAAARKYALNKKSAELGWHPESFLKDGLNQALKPLPVGGFSGAQANDLDNKLSIYRLEDRLTRQSTEAEIPGQIRARLLIVKQENVFPAWFRKIYKEANVSTYL